MFMRLPHPSKERLADNTGVYVPLLFSYSGVGSLTSHKNQINENAVGRNVRFFVLIHED